MKLLSWNVNGIRAISKKGFSDWMKKENADILCIQETKAHVSQVGAALAEPKGYYAYWSSAEKKGYSGTLIYSKEEPKRVLYGMGEPRFDSEGRMVVCEYPNFVLFNVYFPNGQMSEERLLSHLCGLAEQVEGPAAIFNVHVPPFDSGLDYAPELEEDLRLRSYGGQPRHIPVGSTAVRKVIDQFQPLLGLHGHVHESRGVAKIGRTLCVNPGSAYSAGVLQGVLLDIDDGDIKYQFVEG